MRVDEAREDQLARGINLLIDLRANVQSNLGDYTVATHNVSAFQPFGPNDGTSTNFHIHDASIGLTTVPLRCLLPSPRKIERRPERSVRTQPVPARATSPPPVRSRSR